MTAFVFLGPSLSVDRARAILAATYLPPVQRGDVLALLARRPTAIGIVDGYFETVPSVWHKEILQAMAAGVHVFGASSMGALRAAELHAFGMVGVGQAFDWYRSGAIDADDEVAVAHGPAESGFLRLSDALVDLRDAYGAARDAGVIPPELAAGLIALAKALHYRDRSHRTVLLAARRQGCEGEALDRLEVFLASYGPGVKERDAVAMLERMATVLSQSPGPLTVDYRLERTVFLERLAHEIDQMAAAQVTEVPPDADAILRGGESVAVLRKKVLFRLLARREAERIGMAVDESEIAAGADDFRRRFGLLTLADTMAWAAAEGIDDDTFVEVIRDGVLVDKLERLYGHRIGANLAAQVRMATAQGWRARQPRAPI